jgi:transcriptional regulator with XRE-family HTH domain
MDKHNPHNNLPLRGTFLCSYIFRMSMWKNLGKALGLLREVRGKSQSSVAQEAGIGKSQLSKYENGKELPKLDSLEKVLNALEVGHFEFFYTLHLVDGRAEDLSGEPGADGEDASPAAGLPPLSALNRGTSLLNPGTEQAFARLYTELLSLYRALFEQTLASPPPPRSRKARRNAGVPR